MFYAPRHTFDEFMQLHDVQTIMHELRTELFEGEDPYDPDGRQINNLLGKLLLSDDDGLRADIMAKLEQTLFGLDFSDKQYEHYRPSTDDVKLQSYVGQLCSAGKSGELSAGMKKDRIVKLVYALHLKTIPQGLINNKCPTCQQDILDDEVCPSCGTKLATHTEPETGIQKNINNLSTLLSNLDSDSKDIIEAKRLVENLLAWAVKTEGKDWVRPTTQAGIDTCIKNLNHAFYGKDVDAMDFGAYMYASPDSIVGKAGNAAMKRKLATCLSTAQFQLQPRPAINGKCPCCETKVNNGSTHCPNCDAMLKVNGQPPEIDQGLRHVMTKFTKKGHIQELLGLIDDEYAKTVLESLRVSNAVISVNEASQFYSDKEIEDMLENLMEHVAQGEPSDETLNHVDALVIKIRGVNKKQKDHCPICGQHTRDKYECPACGTNFSKARKEPDMISKPKIPLKAIIAILIVVVLLATAIPCIQVVPAGSTGIRVTMGKVDPNLIPPGPTFKLPFVQSIKTVNNKQQTYVFPDRVWGESSEQTVVYMENVAVSYQIMPEYSVWLYSNVTDYQNNALPPALLSSAMKAAMVELGANDVTNRAKIEPIALQKLQEALNMKYGGNEVVHVTSVNINNMDFEDNYNQAIEQRQIAQLEYEKQQIAIKTQLEKAEADKNEREIKANAAAKEKEIQADAEAKAIKSVANAQAEANEKLAKSLTKELVEYQKIEKWDGKMPRVSGGNAIIDMRESNSVTPAE